MPFETEIENHPELSSSMRTMLRVGFMYGRITKAASQGSGEAMRRLITSDFVDEAKDNDEDFVLTLAGINTFTKYYHECVELGAITEDTTINYFRCMFAERIGDGKFDGPVISCSNQGMINFVDFLQLNSHLSLSDITYQCDYAVLEFIDEHTGDTHELYPGDTVVMTEKGYTIHKFSE